jgi:hypothetical protein
MAAVLSLKLATSKGELTILSLLYSPLSCFAHWEALYSAIFNARVDIIFNF